MTANEYQKRAVETAVYPKENPYISMSYLTLGLDGEMGEICDQVKKLIRDSGIRSSLSNLTSEQKDRLVSEMGDYCWYAAMIATENGLDLSFFETNPGQPAKPFSGVDDFRKAVRYRSPDEVYDIHLGIIERLAETIGVSMSYVYEYNIRKLADRKLRGVLAGSGNTR